MPRISAALQGPRFSLRCLFLTSRLLHFVRPDRGIPSASAGGCSARFSLSPRTLAYPLWQQAAQFCCVQHVGVFRANTKLGVFCLHAVRRQRRPGLKIPVTYLKMRGIPGQKALAPPRQPSRRSGLPSQPTRASPVEVGG
eukprot:gene12653-biopygen21488